MERRRSPGPLWRGRKSGRQPEGDRGGRGGGSKGIPETYFAVRRKSNMMVLMKYLNFDVARLLVGAFTKSCRRSFDIPSAVRWM